MKTNLLFFLLFLWPTSLSNQEKYFVVWNVGQGLWTTLINGDTCLHFDMGGEISPVFHLKDRCRINKIHFTHWDLDHVGMNWQAKRYLLRTCMARLPRGPTKLKKWQQVSELPKCKEPKKYDIAFSMNPHTNWTSNDWSRIYLVKSILVPGDSTIRMEKLWATKVQNAHYLITGHHGSRTSTSDLLLRNLPYLKMAITSARKARHGHPHVSIDNRLKKYRIPHVKTEDWGNIFIEL